MHEKIIYIQNLDPMNSRLKMKVQNIYYVFYASFESKVVIDRIEDIIK